MPFDADTLARLLPGIIRLRDRAAAGPDVQTPLEGLLSVLAGTLGVVEDDLAQLHDDHFIETCAEWVVPYLGDLLGVHVPHAVGSTTSGARAVVANTLGYRRRKGTASLLGPLSRDLSGWDVRTVESFRHVIVARNLKHRRPEPPGVPLIRDPRPLGRVGTAFDPFPRLPDVRRASGGRGRFNPTNVSLFVWTRLALPMVRRPATKVDALRWTFSPLGQPAPLFNRPRAGPDDDPLSHGPLPISRLLLHERFSELFGHDDAGHPLSLAVYLDNATDPVPAAQAEVANLSTLAGGAWAYASTTLVAIDPALGRIALPSTGTPPATVHVAYHAALPGPIGGGAYDRGDTLPAPLSRRLDDPSADLQAALDVLAAGTAAGPSGAAVDGELVLAVNATFALTPKIPAAPGRVLRVRAERGTLPVIAATGDVVVSGGDSAADVVLEGLWIAGGTLRVDGPLRSLTLRDCTLVPGLSLTEDGGPAAPGGASLMIPDSVSTLVVERSIVGPLRTAATVEATLTQSVVDATAEDLVALSALDGSGPAGPLVVDRCTVFGRVHTGLFRLGTNSLFLAEGAPGVPPVWSERLQQGCVRYCHVATGSRVPRPYQCRPADGEPAAAVRPVFRATRYGAPGYAQLGPTSPAAVRGGADDESEMGAFHDRFNTRRDSNVTRALDEYLRFGLEAGLVHET